MDALFRIPNTKDAACPWATLAGTWIRFLSFVGLMWIGPVSSAEGPITAPVPGGTTAVLSTNLTSDMDALDDKYRLNIGDHLSFRIVEDRFRTIVDRFRSPEDRKDPKLLLVTDSGDLEVPYIGRYPAAGKTCKQLAREIRAELERDYYKQATVILAVDLMTKSRGKVYLVGQVRLAGALDIPGDEVFTISKAIMRAGGFSEFADRRRVKVTRKGGSDRAMAPPTSPNSKPDNSETQSFEVNVAEILEKGRTEKDIILEPGDLVFVPSRLITF